MDRYRHFLTQVNLQVPRSLTQVSYLACSPSNIYAVGFTLNLGSGNSLGAPEAFSGESFGGVVSVNRGNKPLSNVRLSTLPVRRFAQLHGHLFGMAASINRKL